MEKDWPVQDAKARFSEMMRAAETGPQHITHRGEEKAVLLSTEEYRRLTAPKKKPAKTLYEALRACPYALDLPPRSRDKGREVDL